MQSIEVKTASSYFVRMGCVGALFLGLAAAMGLRATRPGGGAFALLALIFCAIPIVVIAVDRRSWARRIDATGVTLRSGRLLAWNAFQRVVTITYPAGRGVKRYELVFQTGSARVFPLVTENRAEVEAVMQALSRGINPFAGGRA
jgi:hypothetical protein